MRSIKDGFAVCVSRNLAKFRRKISMTIGTKNRTEWSGKKRRRGDAWGKEREHWTIDSGKSIKDRKYSSPPCVATSLVHARIVTDTSCKGNPDPLIPSSLLRHNKIALSSALSNSLSVEFDSRDDCYVYARNEQKPGERESREWKGRLGEGKCENVVERATKGAGGT